MNIDAAKAAHESLVKSGVNFVACLPDSAFQELYLPVSSDPKITYVQVARIYVRHLRTLARADGVWRSYAAIDQPSGRAGRRTLVFGAVRLGHQAVAR